MAPHSSPVRARYGLFLWVQTLIYILHRLLQWCMQHHAIGICIMLMYMLHHVCVGGGVGGWGWGGWGGWGGGGVGWGNILQMVFFLRPRWCMYVAGPHLIDIIAQVCRLSCTLSGDSVLSQSTGLHNAVLSESANEILDKISLCVLTHVRPGKIFSIVTWWLR